MPSDPCDSDIRVAHSGEFARLRELEEVSDEMFMDLGIGPFAQVDEENHLDKAVVVLVSGDPPVGFACVEVVGGEAHIWQLSVHPSASRQGRGTALVGAVCDWARSEGFDAVTLTTFRDVPWNAPFYAKLGFHVLEELTPELAALREHEIAIGDDAFGPRVAMRKDLDR